MTNTDPNSTTTTTSQLEARSMLLVDDDETFRERRVDEALLQEWLDDDTAAADGLIGAMRVATGDAGRWEGAVEGRAGGHRPRWRLRSRSWRYPVLCLDGLGASRL